MVLLFFWMIISSLKTAAEVNTTQMCIRDSLVNMYPSDAVNYLNEGRLVDLSVYINDPEIGIPNFKDNVPAGQYSEITQWGDGIYVFPCTTAGEVLFYNKTMFDKYGLEAPKTWTELAECSKIIHEKEGIPGFGTRCV